MTWEIIKHKDGKVMISVTGNELLGIIPPEVDELIDEHNETAKLNPKLMEKIDVENYFSEKGVYTFNILPENIKFREV